MTDIDIDDIQIIPFIRPSKKKPLSLDIDIQNNLLDLENKKFYQEVEVGYQYKDYVNNIVSISSDKGYSCAICYQKDFVEDTCKEGVVYVLLLEDDYYYVGTTGKFEERMRAHFEGGGGSYWTMKYRPIKILVRISGSDRMELEVTLEYMKRYGIDKVRGSYWCWVEIPEEIRNHLELHLKLH